ncbi:hypothetical protein [Dactylosporangium sp. CA-139066]|uniref:hypothetical protein n=1 Tax=Dactylosporangium sp. CA-139066 TaxID=3239930 RepID=UPI003D924998
MTTFDELFAEVTAGDARFGHRRHVQLTWLALRRMSLAAATELVSDGIRRTARYAGAPQKYHHTMSRAWVELVAARMRPGDADFEAFAARAPEVLDKRLLSRFYRSSTLASAEAKAGWVEPDLAPLTSAGHPPA